MNNWRRYRTISSLSFVCVLLFACSSLDQEREEEAVPEVEPQASPTVHEEPETAVEAPTINLSDGEELVLVAGMFGDASSDWAAGYAVEDEVISSPGPTIKVRKGETVTLTFENAHYTEEGNPFGAVHNLTVVADKDVPWIQMEPLWGTHVGGFGDPNLEAGERGSVTFTPETAGSFYYVCALLDHIDRGMWGRFIVEE